MRLLPYLTAILLYALLATNLSAQVDSSTVWSFKYNNSSFHGYTQFRYQSDTVIGEEVFRNFEKLNLRTAFGTTDTFLFDLGDFYINERDSVFRFLNNASQIATLYDFTLGVGDTFDIPFLNRQDVLDSMHFEVVEEGYGTIGPFTERFQVLLGSYYRDESFNFTFTDTIVYGVGSVCFYIIPYDSLIGSINQEEGAFLKVFENNSLGCKLLNEDQITRFDFSTFCDDTPNSLPATPTAVPFTVVPNPTTGRFRIRLGEEGAGYNPSAYTHAETFDLTGQRIGRFAAGEDVDLTGRPPGVYFVVLYLNGRLVGRRWVVLRGPY